MGKFAFAVPVQPGKREVLDEITNYSRSHMDEYIQSRERAGITMERVSLMQTPMGEFVIPYVEGTKTYAETLHDFQTGGDFDRFFLEKNGELAGIDFSSGDSGPEPELVGEFVDERVSERKAGLSFCAPLAPGQTEYARGFAKQVWTDRREELAASRRSKGFTHETVFLQTTPQGDIVVVYLEGDDPAGGNRQFAESREPFDVWFKDECRKMFIPAIDFNVPLPPIAVVWDWEAATVAR